MAVLNIELDNILAFKNFKASFVYPKKLVNTSLEGEFFDDYPNLRYRKVNVLIGANATAKTSFGKAIWKIFMFLNKKESNDLLDLLANKDKEATILLDYAYPSGDFFRFEVRINGKDITARLQKLQMQKLDTYETLLSRLDNSLPFEHYLKALDGFEFGGWNFAFPAIEEDSNYIECDVPNEDQKEYADLLYKVLSTFDPSILKVEVSNDFDNTYKVLLENNEVEQITHGHKLSDLKRFSSGTKYAVNIANVIYCIKTHKNGFYYIDEQFSYVNSDLEIACLSVMISLLSDGEQLFFTTHNPELLALNLPNHSFNFMKKETLEDGTKYISMINAAELEKRNNVNIKNLYDNDYFNVAPDTSKLFDIGN
jgi:hypothetical protein